MAKKYILLLLMFVNVTLIAQTATVNGTSYNTIAEAYTAASGGDVIIIDGMFDENLTSNKAVSFQGDDSATDGINYTGSGRVLYYTNSVAANFSISNLTISGGDATGNGAGILIDKSKSPLITLSNLIIENNTTTENGGGISINTSNVDIENCIIRNNAAKNGGGIHLGTNNTANTPDVDKTVNVKQSLINNNSSTLTGAGFYLYAGGADVGLTANFENTTVALNTATTNGGIAHIFGQTKTGTSINNVTVNMIHVTCARNTASQATTADQNKFGLYFTKSGATDGTVFNAYNSIFVAAGLPVNRGINFASGDPVKMINCQLGGNENWSRVDDGTGTIRGRTAGQIGLASALSDEGGSSNVLAVSGGTDGAIDFCTSTTGITLPSIDQRGYNRDATPDAGAYEFGGTLSLTDINKNLVSIYPNPASQVVLIKGIEGINSIKIYSVLGKLEKQVQNTNQINISELTSGIHIIQIDSNQGIVTQKFIVK